MGRCAAAGLLGAVVLSFGQGCPGVAPGSGDCAAEDLLAGINVAGVFRYSGDRPYLLSGTITFEQEGNVVRVTDTTYDFSGDRRLRGQGALTGNRLNILLFPKNGDTDYRAHVIFVFSDDGDEFCVEFTDTNGDAGDLGSYRGVRISS